MLKIRELPSCIPWTPLQLRTAPWEVRVSCTTTSLSTCSKFATCLEDPLPPTHLHRPWEARGISVFSDARMANDRRSFSQLENGEMRRHQMEITPSRRPCHTTVRTNTKPQLRTLSKLLIAELNKPLPVMLKANHKETPQVVVMFHPNLHSFTMMTCFVF